MVLNLIMTNFPGGQDCGWGGGGGGGSKYPPLPLPKPNPVYVPVYYFYLQLSGTPWPWGVCYNASGNQPYTDITTQDTKFCMYMHVYACVCAWACVDVHVCMCVKRAQNTSNYHLVDSMCSTCRHSNTAIDHTPIIMGRASAHRRCTIRWE